MQPYDYKGYEPGFTIQNLEFVGTCASHPEQYDVLYCQDDAATQTSHAYQVGYVRLRGGRLRCTFPDVGGETLYYYDYNDDKYRGEFIDEADRMYHLNLIAYAIKQKLDAISYGYS